MLPFKRLFLKVNPKEEYKQGEIYTLHHHFGADTEGTIRHGIVWKVPKGINWTEEGDIVWFTQQASQQQGTNEQGSAPCTILEQENGELWALSIPWAEQTILGVQRGDKLLSSPNYVAASPIEVIEGSVLDIEIQTLNKEEEVRATSLENKEGIKEGDVIHFERDYDYPSKDMASKWVQRDNKRVIFIRKENIFGYERNGKFTIKGDWIITEPLDEGDEWQSNSFGILVKKENLKDDEGNGKICYSNSKELLVGDVIKSPKRGYRRLEIAKKVYYAIPEEDVMLKYI